VDGIGGGVEPRLHSPHLGENHGPTVTTDAALDRTVLGLTGAKITTNGALRWVYPFLPAIGRGIGADLATMSRAAGLAELAGLASIVIGPQLDRGCERRWLAGGVLTAAVGCSIAPLGGSLLAFTLGFALVTAGVSVFTTAGQTWIGERVPFETRARAIGVFESAWAVSVLVMAPVAAALVGWVAWWTPFAVLAVVNALAAALLRARLPADVIHPASRRARLQVDRKAVAVIATSWLTGIAAMAVFVSYGAWLEDEFGFSVGAIGVVSVLAALVELAGSWTTALRADRWGKHRAVQRGLLLMIAASILLPLGSVTPALAIAALVFFLGTFEFSFVTNIALVTEAAVASRGAVVGLTNAGSTVARAGGVAVGGAAYAAAGMTGVAMVSGTAATLALLAATVARRESASVR
jgi:predicted MFS family arabinose efflux permease